MTTFLIVVAIMLVGFGLILLFNASVERFSPTRHGQKKKAYKLEGYRKDYRRSLKISMAMIAIGTVIALVGRFVG